MRGACKREIMGLIAERDVFKHFANNQIERRRATRMLIEIPVKLECAGMVHTCHMTNISDTGARLETPTPPATGNSAFLVMSEDRIACQIVWMRQQSFGIHFDRNLGEARLDTITAASPTVTEEADPPNTPEPPATCAPATNHAAPSNGFGRKRAALIARGEARGDSCGDSCGD